MSKIKQILQTFAILAWSFPICLQAQSSGPHSKTQAAFAPSVNRCTLDNQLLGGVNEVLRAAGQKKQETLLDLSPGLTIKIQPATTDPSDQMSQVDYILLSVQADQTAGKLIGSVGIKMKDQKNIKTSHLAGLDAIAMQMISKYIQVIRESRFSDHEGLLLKNCTRGFCRTTPSGDVKYIALSEKNKNVPQELQYKVTIYRENPKAASSNESSVDNQNSFQFDLSTGVLGRRYAMRANHSDDENRFASQRPYQKVCIYLDCEKKAQELDSESKLGADSNNLKISFETLEEDFQNLVAHSNNIMRKAIGESEKEITDKKSSASPSSKKVSFKTLIPADTGNGK